MTSEVEPLPFRSSTSIPTLRAGELPLSLKLFPGPSTYSGSAVTDPKSCPKLERQAPMFVLPFDSSAKFANPKYKLRSNCNPAGLLKLQLQSAAREEFVKILPITRL